MGDVVYTTISGVDIKILDILQVKKPDRWEDYGTVHCHDEAHGAVLLCIDRPESWRIKRGGDVIFMVTYIS
jgi:hypothetical protein